MTTDLPPPHHARSAGRGGLPAGESRAGGGVARHKWTPFRTGPSGRTSREMLLLLLRANNHRWPTAEKGSEWPGGAGAALF